MNDSPDRFADRATEDHLRQILFDRTRGGLAVVSVEGTVLEANPGAARMLGFERPEDLEGTAISDLYCDVEQRGLLLETLETEGGEVGGFEAHLRGPDGRERWVLMDIVREHDPTVGEDVLLETWADITDRHRLRDELEAQALRDSLTGLPNRRGLYERADQILAICQRQDRMAALIYLDLIGFRQVNERLGHRGGDEVLKKVGRRLAGEVRDSDVASRIGGDEFVVLAPLLGGEEDAVQAARRIISQSFGDSFTVEEDDVHLEPAVGVALFPDHATDFDQLLDRADRALWGPERKKVPGLRLYRQGLEMEVSDILRRQQELQRALLTEPPFRLHYQPVVRSDSGEVVGTEALIRWQHPEMGLVPAGDFIPVAEASGLVTRIDRWVLEEASRQAARWQETGDGPGWIAVNLSPQTLGDPELPRFIREQLEGVPGLDPRRLVLEITEHAVMRKEKTVDRIMELLDTEVGLSLAIDDFGTGYSSLLYLRRFPADYLKIDMTFVHGLGTSEADEKVVRAIIALGHQFDMELIGEGVETAEQREWLREAACDYLQGYLCGRPEPASPRV